MTLNKQKQKSVLCVCVFFFFRSMFISLLSLASPCFLTLFVHFAYMHMFAMLWLRLHLKEIKAPRTFVYLDSFCCLLWMPLGQEDTGILTVNAAYNTPSFCVCVCVSVAKKTNVHLTCKTCLSVCVFTFAPPLSKLTKKLSRVPFKPPPPNQTPR